MPPPEHRPKESTLAAGAIALLWAGPPPAFVDLTSNDNNDGGYRNTDTADYSRSGGYNKSSTDDDYDGYKKPGADEYSGGYSKPGADGYATGAGNTGSDDY